MPDHPTNLHFHGPGVRAELDCTATRCQLAISVDGRRHPDCDAVHLEVLFQSHDRHRLPCGAPALLYASTWPLEPPAPDGSARVQAWLPRSLPPELATRCYYRAAPTILEPSSN